MIPYENNPRHNEAAVDKVAQSIKEFGFKVPIIIDKNNVIITGHTRLKAAKKLGLKDVPVIVADDLTPEKVKAFRLADNKVSEYATWDEQKLYNELLELKVVDFNIETFGFETNDIDISNADVDAIVEKFENEALDAEPTEIVEDEVPEPPTEPISKLGDIYQLGNHRLMCGDSTSIDDVEKLMNGVKADMVFTDPPYGMKKESDGVVNDNLNYDDLLEFNKKWIPLTFNYSKDNGSWYCWGIDEPLMDIYSHILKPMKKENKISIQNYITWKKESGFGMSSNLMRSYSVATEKCWFVIKGVQGYNNNSDNYYEGFESIRKYLEDEMNKCGGSKNWKRALGNQMGHHYFTKSQWCFPTKDAYEKLREFGLNYDAFNKEYDVIKQEYDVIKQEWFETRAYFNNTHDNMTDVWEFNRTTKTERELAGGHATPKPIALCSRAIKSSSRENEIVLDVFGGSGSTLIACEQLNRTCYMMEFEPKWVDVIIKRWETLTGKKAVKLNG